MEWYKWEVVRQEEPISLYSQNNEVWLNDKNLKPDWVEHPARFTEFHVKRNKENLLVVIGESWTYGESLNGIATASKKYSIRSQLTYGFGANMALALDTDYYQYAVPGNCNFYMFNELSRIIPRLKTLGYKKIYLCLQMTEPGRERAITDKLKDHPLDYLYNKITPMTFDRWLQLYDELFFRQYDKVLKENNIDHAILWKNFCSTNTDTREYSFDIIETSWIKHSASLMGIELMMPKFYSIGWLADFKNDYEKILSFDNAMLSKQIDIIEVSNAYLGTSPRHRHHPNEVAHLLWSQYLLIKSGWKDV